MQPSPPNVTVAWGAAPSHWFIEPHSSASTWPKLIQRSWSTGITLGHRLGHGREQGSQAGVEQERLVSGDQDTG